MNYIARSEMWDPFKLKYTCLFKVYKSLWMTWLLQNYFSKMLTGQWTVKSWPVVTMWRCYIAGEMLWLIKIVHCVASHRNAVQCTRNSSNIRNGALIWGEYVLKTHRNYNKWCFVIALIYVSLWSNEVQLKLPPSSYIF